LYNFQHPGEHPPCERRHDCYTPLGSLVIVYGMMVFIQLATMDQLTVDSHNLHYA